MAIASSSVRFILQSIESSGPLGLTATLGRLACYSGSACADAGQFDVFARARLGATRVDEFDASDYEGAAFVQDFNQPIPSRLAGTYDTVIDGGTLEHVFNFPVAIDNCMKLLKAGGRFFMFTPANNLCGHGFYQFSPELVYRVFSREHGFSVERVACHETWFQGVERGDAGAVYDVRDPKEIGARITLMSCRPIMMMVCARKVGEGSSVLQVPPQQSDYSAAWEKDLLRNTESGPTRDSASRLKAIFRRVLQCLPGWAETRIRSAYERSCIHSLRNGRFATRASPEDPCR